MAGAAAERDMESIPENVLFEIFSRVRNLKHLFRCAVTCKRWLRLFTDPSFLRKLLPDEHHHAPPLLVGFFWEDKVESRRTQQGSSSSSVLTFLPTPESPVGSKDCTLANFVPGYHHPTVNHPYVEYLASRHGILLTRFLHAESKTNVEGKKKLHLRKLFGVCDPITGAHDVLPELDCACCTWLIKGYAILTADDLEEDYMDINGEDESTSGFSSFSQLLVVSTKADDPRQMHVHTYSAATRSWNNAPVNLTLTNGVYLRDESIPAVVHRSSAHWLYVAADSDHLHILSVEICNTTERVVSIDRLPIGSAAGTTMLCVGRDDRLMIASVRAANVHVWTLQRDGHVTDPAAWTRAPQAIEVPWAAPDRRSTCWLQNHVDWFHINRGTVLGVHGYGRISFVVDLETGAVHKVMDLPLPPPSKSVCRYVPYTMDLLQFFLAQLAFCRYSYCTD